jgi:hypothetical protein
LFPHGTLKALTSILQNKNINQKNPDSRKGNRVGKTKNPFLNMKTYPFIKASNLLCFMALLIILALSCKKNNTPTPSPIVPVDDVTQVVASVSGIVLDETNNPIQGAIVTSGTSNTITNAFGTFNFHNISLSKNNGSITAIKAGFFKGVRSFITTAGKQHQIKLQLMKKGAPIVINSSTGGVVTTNGGAKITFPPNVFTTNSGAAYTGNVNVYSRWIDPTASNLPFIIPGDLRGLNTNGTESILTTYGMIGAELEDLTGNVLKIAPGKTADINLPIPSSILATAPISVPLWHFDDATARWKEEGVATKTGSNYIAQVNKFSFWNVDVPGNFVNLDYTLVNAVSSAPLASTTTRIKQVSISSYGYGYTNTSGFVAGAVPKNEALILEVLNSCGSVIYSQPIGPFSANTSLGNINVALPASQMVTFTGSLQNCSSTLVSNGYIVLYSIGGFSTTVPVSATGTFTVSTINCNGATNFSFLGVDITTAQQSNISTITTTSGTVNLGAIIACNGTPTEYINVIVNGVPSNFTFLPQSSNGLDNSLLPFTHAYSGIAYQLPDTTSKLCLLEIYNNNNISNGVLETFMIGKIDATNTLDPEVMQMGSLSGAPVTFTQFGTIPSSFVAGNFSLLVRTLSGINIPATCSFKLRRQ